jgi:radical SAM protein with 4Fe4S-binding SPASM domain
MDGKTYLTNKSFCPLPWTGFILEPNGDIKNCIVSKDVLGNINDQDVVSILKDSKNQEIKSCMLQKIQHPNCNACYELEKNKKSFEINSSRIYYLQELKKTNMDIYNNLENFSLKQVDLRWDNTCNFACVYCSPNLSSTWEKELNIKIQKPNKNSKQKLKEFVFENITNLSNVYLAGGEPLLMKENEEFLELLYNKNPNVTIRVNTNLSKTKTKVFNFLTKFPNVHWTVSLDSMDKEFEYMRYGSKWDDFCNNLVIIKNLNHKISFNMLWTILNLKSLFYTIDYLNKLGFHNNSFILGPVRKPDFLNVKNLPQKIKDDMINFIMYRLEQKPGFLLEDSYKNLLSYISLESENNMTLFYEKILELDTRRGTNFNLTFPELYAILQDERQ